MQKLIFALALGRAAAQTTAPSYAPTEAESVAPSYAPTDTVYPYDPSATPTGGFPSATPTAKPTTPAPSTETGAPSATPAPTATKAQVVVIRQTTAGLTLAGCLASKDAFQATFAAQLGVATRLIVVVCEEITITRRRLTTGETIEVVIEYKCGPDNTAVCNTVFETAGDLTPDSINAELQLQIQQNPSLDPTGELATVTVQDIISVEEIPQEDFTDTDSPISSPTMAPTADPTSKPTSEPTAVPAPKPTAKPTFMPTMTPTAAPNTRRRALTEEETSGKPSQALRFVDYGMPGTGAPPNQRRRLFNAAKGCQSPEWADGKCAILLKDVPSVCGEWSDCAGAICGGKGFVIAGSQACLAVGAIDYAAKPRKDVYALVKDSSDLLGFLGSEEDAAVPKPATRKMLFAAANYGSEVIQVLKDIWHR